MNKGVHLFTFHSGLLLTNSVLNSFVSTWVETTALFGSAWPASAEVALFTQKCCEAGMNHSLFMVSHEESPGMWDATSDIGLMSEVLFVGGFKCVGEDKQGSSQEEAVLWWEGAVVAWFGFELFPSK